MANVKACPARSVPSNVIPIGVPNVVDAVWPVTTEGTASAPENPLRINCGT